MRNAYIFTALMLISGSAPAATEAQEAALREIEAFSATHAKSDPHYLAVEDELLKKVDDIIKNQPVREWAPTIKRLYFGLSARAHAEERARIRQTEQTIAAAYPSSPDARVGAFESRLDMLEKELMTGKIGPRLQALHALEAAMALFPADELFIAWRQAKVPLASAYEIGAITLPEFEERWARASATYRQNAGAREQAIVQEISNIERENNARVWRGISDGIRRSRGITCTPGPLGSMTCR